MARNACPVQILPVFACTSCDKRPSTVAGSHWAIVKYRVNRRTRNRCNALRMRRNETPHVFVSFASEDIELARRAVHSLERAGFRCWFSERDIEPAASYPASITDALAHSGALLLILTESANTSPHVVREIELAFNARRPILPIRLSGVLPSSDLDYFLSKTQWLDAGSRLDDAELERVEHRLRELLRAVPVIRRRITGSALVARVRIGAAVLVAAAAIVIWTTQRQRHPGRHEHAGA